MTAGAKLLILVGLALIVLGILQVLGVVQPSAMVLIITGVIVIINGLSLSMRPGNGLPD